jgi:hypothetical protein
MTDITYWLTLLLIVLLVVKWIMRKVKDRKQAQSAQSDED